VRSRDGCLNKSVKKRTIDKISLDVVELKYHIKGDLYVEKVSTHKRINAANQNDVRTKNDTIANRWNCQDMCSQRIPQT